MEIFNHTENCKTFSCFFIGDVHEGNSNHNSDAFEKAVKIIQKTSHPSIVITMGDICECIDTKDPRFSPAEIEDKYAIRDLKDLPRKQFKKVFEKLKPIKDKIKYVVAGNHEESFIRHNGFDVIDYFTTDLLGLDSSAKLGYSAIGKIVLTNHGKTLTLKLSLTHGTGGGGFREGYPVNNCLDIFKKFDCDIHVMGHTHKFVNQSFPFISVNKVGKRQDRVKWFCNTGCFMDTYKEGNRNYFEGKKGMVSEIGFLELHAYEKHGWHYSVKKHQYINGEYYIS